MVIPQNGRLLELQNQIVFIDCDRKLVFCGCTETLEIIVKFLKTFPLSTEKTLSPWLVGNEVKAFPLIAIGYLTNFLALWIARLSVIMHRPSCVYSHYQCNVHCKSISSIILVQR